MVEEKNRSTHFFCALRYAFFFEILFGIIPHVLRIVSQHNDSAVHNNTKINSTKRQKVSRISVRCIRIKADKQ